MNQDHELYAHYGNLQMTVYYKFVKVNHHTIEGTLVRTYSFKNIDYVRIKGQYGFRYKYCHRFKTRKEIYFTSSETCSLITDLYTIILTC